MDTPPPVESPNTPDLSLAKRLRAAAPQEQIEILQSLSGPEAPDKATVRAVESLAIAADGPVRQAALQTLLNPAFQTAQRRERPLSASQRALLLRHIAQWEEDGLLSDFQAATLRTRYPHPASRREQAVQKQNNKAASKTPATLSETLLSETAVKTALYLGAFFVLSAAFIFAAVIEVMRLPILLGVTVLALGTALGLRRRLPQASFIFAVLGTLLAPLDAGVLADLLALSGAAHKIFWLAASLAMAALWVGATWLYQSRLFSLLALLAANAAGAFLGYLFSDSGYVRLFFASVPTVGAGLPGTIILRRWRGKQLFKPLFLFAQAEQVLWLAMGAVGFVMLAGNRVSPPFEWVFLALLFATGALFFALSHKLWPFPAFPWLAAAALWPVPLFFLQALSDSDVWRSLTLLGWGTLLALGGEAAFILKNRASLRGFAWPLWGASTLAFLGATALQVELHPGWAALILGWAAVVYAVSTWRQPRWPVWTATLLAALGSYGLLFLLPWVKRFNMAQMWVWMLPAMLLLGAELWTRSRKMARCWQFPLLALGALTLGWGVVWAIGGALIEGHSAWQSAAFFFLWTVYGAGYAALTRRFWIGYAVTASFMLSAVFGLIAVETSYWLLPLMLLAVFYFAAGWGLGYLPALKDWANVARWSGLLYGALWTLTAPVQGGASSVIAAALAAGCWTVEAVRRKNVWLGFPANGLYLMAYFMALITLDIKEPQFYSIGAALLGLLMHYLLRRAGQTQAALITGIVAQLILFSVTYIQTLRNEQFIFFLALFLQAVIVLAYGVITRLRSFIALPIIFVVLSVITLAFSLFSGIPAMLLIGCVGTLLLMGGVAALLMRERKGKDAVAPEAADERRVKE